MKNTIIKLQTKSGELEIIGDITNNNLWASQKQIADIYGIDRSVVTRHINNIFKTKEVKEKSNVQKMHIAKSDKPVKFYSLDIILAVGYRTNSSKAIKFRKWSNKVLKEYVINGFSINYNKVKTNYNKFNELLNYVKTIKLAASDDEVISLIQFFAKTWFSLEAFDSNTLPSPQSGITKASVKLTSINFINTLNELKTHLISKQKATEFFAKENNKNLIEGIFGNIYQSSFGERAYPTIESQASHLFYFIVKNHPFIDGNKRSGAFAFIWFLKKSNFNFSEKITPETLTCLALIIAKSLPKEKDQMIGLILLLIK